MPRVIVLLDLVVILVVLFFGIHMCLWGYREYKKSNKSK